MSFDLGAYLQRIELFNCRPTLAGLKRLQFAQMRQVAFENVAPYLGSVPDLSPEAIWEKLVTGGCGGYCFELNRLFGAAMAAIGFSIRPVLGRVRMGAPVGGPRTHLAWIVSLGSRTWLADAGFGGPGPVEPLGLDEDGAQTIRGIGFRVRSDPESGERVIERATETGWFALYGFDQAPVPDVDVEAANFLCSRWSKSPFPANLMLHRVTDAGRISLLNKTMRNVRGKETEVSVIGSLAGLEDCLVDGFGLRYEGNIVQAIWDKLRAKGDEATA